MLDVPIIYKGETIGVICIESLTLREWDSSEVDFAQLLSSLYSFTYSVKEGNDLLRINKETENFLNCDKYLGKVLGENTFYSVTSFCDSNLSF